MPVDCILVGTRVTFVPEPVTGPGVTTVEIGRPGKDWLVTVHPFFNGELADMYSYAAAFWARREPTANSGRVQTSRLRTNRLAVNRSGRLDITTSFSVSPHQQSSPQRNTFSNAPRFSKFDARALAKQPKRGQRNLSGACIAAQAGAEREFRQLEPEPAVGATKSERVSSRRHDQGNAAVRHEIPQFAKL